LISAKTMPTVLKALWIACFFISSIWFLYWIYYDVYVWSKALSQVPLQNYLGLTMSIVLIVLGTQFEKIGISWRLIHLTTSVQNKLMKRTQVQRVGRKQIRSSADVKQIPPVIDEEKQIPKGSSIPPGCRFYLGYLHQRKKSVDIPEECLECGQVVECLSPAVNIIEEQSSNS
jgi:hypothetical protein